MLPIQRSTPAEGSVGGVGGASTTTSRRLATATTRKGRCSGRSATTAPAASIRRSSLKAGIVAPCVMLRKLAAYRGQNQLDLALQELGRIERALFMLDWLESPELRRRCHAGLNKSEQRHFLAQVICTFKQGRMVDSESDYTVGPAGRRSTPASRRGGPATPAAAAPRACRRCWPMY